MEKTEGKDVGVIGPGEVKRIVNDDLKARHLTRIDVAKKLGLSRQTIGLILSSSSYFFSEKHAALLNLAYGYNKQFLMSGIGSLYEKDGIETLTEDPEQANRVLQIFRYANHIQGIALNAISLANDVDIDVLSLMVEVKHFRGLLSTIDAQVQYYTKERMLVLSFIESSWPLLKKSGEEIIRMCSKDYGVTTEL